MQVGSWNKLPMYSVVGSATEFYVWYESKTQKGRASRWLKGQEAFQRFHTLRKLHKKDKDKFCKMVKEIHEKM